MAVVAVLLVVTPLVVVDVMFFSANLLKLLEGAWAPLLFGAAMVLLILTWRRGTGILAQKTRRSEVPIDALLASLEKNPPHMVPRHRRVPHQPARIRADRAAAQSQAQQGAARAQCHPHHHHDRHAAGDAGRAGEDHGAVDHFSLVALKFGYMESPNVPKALAIARKHGWQFDIMSTSFFLSRRALKPSAQSGMPLWQDRLFIGLAKSASDATDFFQIPTGRVVEVGHASRRSEPLTLHADVSY